MLKLTPILEDQTQTDLFGSGVHEVVREKGAKGAVEAARITALTPRPGSLPKALAGRMGRQIANTAAGSIVRDFEGNGEEDIHVTLWSRIMAIIVAGDLAVNREIYDELIHIQGPVGDCIRANEPALVLEVGQATWNSWD